MKAKENEDIETYLLTGDLSVSERFFTVPLDYNKPDGNSITVFARIIERHDVPAKRKEKETKDGDRAWLLFLNGGPGFENGSPQASYVCNFVSKDYTVVMIDQRGTGLSECISPENIPGSSAEEKAEYVSMFRADNIVRDCEFVREKLLGKEGKWSLAGQSFGGFCIASYLSFFPQNIVEAFMFGGIPPIGENNPDEVYKRLYNKVRDRNIAYYKKYPKDIARIQEIADYLTKNTVVLPSGGVLTLDRFRGLGIAFGVHGGIDSIHKVVLRVHNDLSRFGKILTPAKIAFEHHQSFDSNILYCILHEAIYCQDGQASLWSANREPREQADGRLHWYRAYQQAVAGKSGVDSALFFTGEMVFESMLDDYAALREVKEIGEILATKKWEGRLYDLAVLAKNTVPIYAATYLDDMYVDFKLARVFAENTGNFHEFITNDMFHNAIRAKTEEVMRKLWTLRKGVRD